MKKKSKHHDLVKELLEFTIIIILLVSFVYFSSFMLGQVTASDISQTNFSGTYDDTVYSVDHIGLASSKTAGNYTSRIFDATANATWKNLTAVDTTPSASSLVAVDGGGDVYKSTNSGVTWIQMVNNYGRTTATAKMFTDNEYLYILSTNGNEVWRSSNGTNFEMIYSGFNSKSPLLGKPDINGNVFVITTPGEVWKSTNNGIDWTLVGDFNPGTQTAKAMGIDSNNYMYAVDGTGTVYKSINGGVDWTEINSGYGGSTATDGMVVDSNDNLYILLNEEIFKSTNSGVDWTSINDSFSPYANVPVEIGIDSSDNIFVLDAVGRVFKSTNYGVTWTEIGDLNNGETNNPKGMTAFIQPTNLSYQIRSCYASDCSDASFASVDVNNINLSARYFQYKVFFASPNTATSPYLYNVTIQYDLITTTSTQEVNVTSIELNEETYCASNNIYIIANISDSENVTAVAAIFSNGTIGSADDYEISLGITDEDETNLTWSNEWKIPNNINTGSWNITIKVYNNSAILGQNNMSFIIASDGPGYVQVYAPANANVNTNITATIEVRNNNTLCDLNYSVEYWIADLDNSINYDSIINTISIPKDSGVNISATRTVPAVAKTYAFIALITWPSDNDFSFDAFTGTGTATTTTIATTTTTGGSGSSSDLTTTITNTSTTTSIKTTEITQESETTYTSIDFDDLADESKGTLSSGIAGQVIGLENMSPIQLTLTFLLLIGITVFALRKKIPFIKNYFKK